MFIDELDAVGGKRDEIGGSNHTRQTINQLLNEIGGFRGDEGILVIAATNLLDSLDPALVRAGRFDLEVKSRWNTPCSCLYSFASSSPWLRITSQNPPTQSQRPSSCSWRRPRASRPCDGRSQRSRFGNSSQCRYYEGIVWWICVHHQTTSGGVARTSYHGSSQTEGRRWSGEF